MLVLQRSVGEIIQIGDDIAIVITDGFRGGAKVGILAPKHLNITRPETRGFTVAGRDISKHWQGRD